MNRTARKIRLPELNRALEGADVRRHVFGSAPVLTQSRQPVFPLHGKMAEAAAVPPHRFFCHCCKGEVSPKLPEYICPRCDSGFIEEVTEDSSLLDSSSNGLDDTASQFAELWQLLFVERPFTVDLDSPDSEPRVPGGGGGLGLGGGPFGGSVPGGLGGGLGGPLGGGGEHWGPGRPPRLHTQRRYRSRGSSRPDRSPAVEG
ncbi:hypothetical protein SRHO_G00062480 [Serrasalmus rhombeus]